MGTFGPTFWGHFFRSQQKSRELFGAPSWGEAICDPTGRRGELEAPGGIKGILEASERHLGGIWEGSERLGIPRGSQGDLSDVSS